MERQDRWRPAWFAEVERGGETVPVYLRGARPANAAVFPEHKREADVLRVLAAHGIPVPRIYGYCEDPDCIVMETLAGTRDMDAAPDPATQAGIIRELVEALAAMHRIPPQEFAAAGVDLPQSRADQCLAGVRAYMPHYRRIKRGPEPLLEFAIRWMERHLPAAERPAAFVQYDCGQFHHAQGRLTGLYDFEFSVVGDPMMDLATLAMREVAEHYGVSLPEVGRLYEEASGAPLDHDAITFYTLQFGTVGAMQFAGAVRDMRPGDPHGIYLAWNRGLRRNIAECLCRLSGLPYAPEPAIPGLADDVLLVSKLEDLVRQIPAEDAVAEGARQAALDVAEVLAKVVAAGRETRAVDIAAIARLVGRPLDDWAAAEQALEDFVLVAGPEHDDELVTLFARMEARQESLLAGTRIGESGKAAHLRSFRAVQE